MKFEDLASKSGRSATSVGRSAKRPELNRMLIGRRRRAALSVWSAGAVVGLAVVGVVSAGLKSEPNLAATPGSSTTTRSAAPVLTPVDGVPVSCPITVLGETTFTPSSETPRDLSAIYGQVWFGTPELWTRISPAGEAWRGLPVGPDGEVGNKTIWWSKHYSPEDPGRISVTAEHLDGSAPIVEVEGRAGGGHTPFDGHFILVGLEIPEPGCWEVTAEYRGASLSYVIWVDHG